MRVCRARGGGARWRRWRPAAAADGSGSDERGRGHRRAPDQRPLRCAEEGHRRRATPRRSSPTTTHGQRDVHEGRRAPSDWADGLHRHHDDHVHRRHHGRDHAPDGRHATMQARYLPDAYYVEHGRRRSPRRPAASTGSEYGYDDLAEHRRQLGRVPQGPDAEHHPGQSVKLLLASRRREEGRLGDGHGASRPTHYRGTVDVAELARMNVQSLDAEELDAAQEAAERKVHTETVDLWIDGDDLLVKKQRAGRMTTGELDSTVYYTTTARRLRRGTAHTVDFDTSLIAPSALKRTPTDLADVPRVGRRTARGRAGPTGRICLAGPPFAYSPAEAKDRWSLPCARKRARWPKDPLNCGRPAQVTVDVLPESLLVRVRSSYAPCACAGAFRLVPAPSRAVRITRKEAEALWRGPTRLPRLPS